MLPHDLHKGKCGIQVVSEILKRLLHALAHGLEPRKMYYLIYMALVEHATQRLFVAHIHIEEQRSPARNALDPGQRLLVAVAKIVHHHDIVAMLQQLDARMRPNEPSSTCNENHSSLHILYYIILFLDRCPCARPLRAHPPLWT